MDFLTGLNSQAISRGYGKQKRCSVSRSRAGKTDLVAAAIYCEADPAVCVRCYATHVRDSRGQFEIQQFINLAWDIHGRGRHANRGVLHRRTIRTQRRVVTRIPPWCTPSRYTMPAPWASRFA